MAWWSCCAWLALVPVIEGAFECPSGSGLDSEGVCEGLEYTDCSETTCCETTCGSYTCEAGYKDKSGIADTKQCTSSSCVTECCDLVDGCLKLKNTGSTCASTKFPDPTKYGVEATTSDFGSKCCTDKAKCSSLTCDTGYKTTDADRECVGGADTCSNAYCCELKDVSKKLKDSTSCDSGKFYDTSKEFTDATTANFQTTCCTDSLACKDAVAPSDSANIDAALREAAPSSIAAVITAGAAAVAARVFSVTF